MRLEIISPSPSAPMPRFSDLDPVAKAYCNVESREGWRYVLPIGRPGCNNLPTLRGSHPSIESEASPSTPNRAGQDSYPAHSARLAHASPSDRLGHRGRLDRRLLPPGALLRQAVGQEHLGILRLGPLGAVVAGGALDGRDDVLAATRPTSSPTSSAPQGVAGNWQWWAFVLTGVATVFFYARLWRRSGVLTDLEFYELRYSGKAAELGARLPRGLPRASSSTA